MARTEQDTVPAVDRLPNEGSSTASLPAPGRYTLTGFLGAGGMGEVCRVWDAHLERPLALKRMRSELAGRRRPFDDSIGSDG